MCEKSFEEEIVDEIRNLIKNAKAQLINQEEGRSLLSNILIKIEQDMLKKGESKKQENKQTVRINTNDIKDIKVCVENEYKENTINHNQENIITFIIPSIGRNSLLRTINSLQAQTITNWLAIIVYDGVAESQKIIKEDFDKRVKIISLEKPLGTRKSSHFHGHAGNVRNVGLKEVKTEWIGFVDDDDYLLPTYIQTLLNEANDCDLFVFRMSSPSCGIVPNIYDNTIRPCNIGISFAVKNSFIKKHGIQFVQYDQEDGRFAITCVERGSKYKVTKDVFYIAT